MSKTKLNQLTIKDFFNFLSKIKFPILLINDIERRNYFFKPKEEFLNNEDEICWEWTAYRNRDGYGILHSILASRCSYYFFNNKDPNEFQVCHSCDNPGCVNPNHLWIGTAKENIRDKTLKGNSAIKLTELLIKNCFMEIENIRITNIEEMMAYLNIGRAACWKLLRGDTWSHVTNNLNHPLNFYKEKILKPNLSNQDIINIYIYYHKYNKPVDELCDKYLMSQGLIYKILNKKAYKEILNKIDLNIYDINNDIV